MGPMEVARGGSVPRRPPRGHGVLGSSLRLPRASSLPVHHQSARREVRTLSPRAPSKANTSLRGWMMLYLVAQILSVEDVFNKPSGARGRD